ncbi:transglycosylase family protein [Streptomyces sp. N2-109]|uniref:Transglycosylase family protein n=1 Tax=Streptomyces gossypii TaxID=2883101 RepID=A0ABT2JZ41_9ACTN|nr:transglycosylase family protein [Streptomyces gossypii]MCT2592961.1 transglycosylase family protein [Streptomyces gossypii]MCT2593694.1 transglycosylase family protein [Streptomyces gossypii]
MRSGNGRHRRPRQAPAFFVAAGVTGAGIAMPLLGAGAAQADDGSTWDRVAQCESGGLWSSNSGNGQYGGLQLTQDVWEQYGGRDFAERPDLASRSQQIAVAEKILADKGPSAWPSCSVTSGLGEVVEELPDVDPDATGEPAPEPTSSGEPAPEPSDTDTSPDTDGPSAEQPSERPSERPSRDESAGPSDKPSESPSETGGSDSSDASDGSGESDGSQRTDGSDRSPDGADTPDTPEAEAGTEGEGTGKHRGAPDDRQRDGSDRASRGSHGKDGKSGRDGKPEPAGEYRVESGDSLSAIAADLGLDGGWTSLYEGNRDTVGSDPDLILPGQSLTL